MSTNEWKKKLLPRLGAAASVLLVLLVISFVASLLIPRSVVEIRPDSGKFKEITAGPAEGSQNTDRTVLIFRTDNGSYKYAAVHWQVVGENQPEYLKELRGYFGELQDVNAYVHASRWKD